MKLLVVAAILGVCLADRLDNKYLPPRGNSGAGGFGPGFGAAGAPAFGHSGGNFGAGAGGAGAAGGYSSGFGGQHSGNVYNAGQSQYSGGSQYNARGGAASADASAQILRQNSEVTAEGFSYDFETSNGIRADAQGVATNGVQSQGSFAYKGDDGQEYSIQYTADENGYQPRGAHLPTPPPIPEEILKSLEQNARDEAAGIVDDGTYRGEGAGSGGYSSGGYSNSGSGYNSQNAGGYSGQNAGYTGQNTGYSGQNAGYSGQNAGYNAQSGASKFGGASNFGGRQSSGGFGAKATASRQYLAPNAGSRGSGNGNFNQQSGYQY